MSETGDFTVGPKGMMEQVITPGTEITVVPPYTEFGNIQEPEAEQAPPKAESPTKPSIGRVVVYRSRTGNYSVPAIINCAVDSIYQPGVEHGFVPPITGKDNVHLTVFSPGRAGMRVDQEQTPGAENFVNPSKYPVSENVSGCYQEWDIEYDEDGGAGTWMWPARV